MVIYIQHYLMILTIYKLLGSDLQCGHSDKFSVNCFNGFYDHVLGLALALPPLRASYTVHNPSRPQTATSLIGMIAGTSSQFNQDTTGPSESSIQWVNKALSHIDVQSLSGRPRTLEHLSKTHLSALPHKLKISMALKKSSLKDGREHATLSPAFTGKSQAF